MTEKLKLECKELLSLNVKESKSRVQIFFLL